MNRAAVLLTGAIAVALVARAASIYRGSDSLAFALVLLIGLGLILGLCELLVRATQAARLAAEINALPKTASLEMIDRASPPLAALLRARIAGVSGVSASAPFTPYLLGLLVMIGLLGTFLGLFETLRGAREALTASGDVEALRTGLAAPMAGLSRAFGTSAAGVSASAMLGLGAVFVRRAEAQAQAALARYAAGPLAALTHAGRQLAALEAISLASQALPEASASLRDAADRLAALEKRLVEAQEKSGAETAAAIRATAAEVRGDLAAGIDRAAKATAAAVEPLLAGAVERAGASAGATLTGFTGRLGEKLATESSERREREAEHLRAIEALAASATARLGDDAAARGEALEERLIGAVEELSHKASAGAEILRAETAAQAESLQLQASKLTEAMAAAAAQGGAFAERVDEVAASLVKLTEVSATRLDALDTASAQRLDALDTASAKRLDALTAKLAETAGAVASANREEADRVKALADASAERSAAAEARAEERLVALTSQVRDSLEQQATRAAERDTKAAERQAALTSQVEAVASQAQAVIAGQAERLVAFEERLERARGASAEALAERLGDHAKGLGESLSATATLVREASDVLRAGGAEMASVAELFAGSVDRYRAASDRWLDNLGAIEDAIARKDGGEAADLLGAYLDQTREVFDHSLRFQRELFTELRALRSKAS